MRLFNFIANRLAICPRLCMFVASSQTTASAARLIMHTASRAGSLCVYRPVRRMDMTLAIQSVRGDARVVAPGSMSIDFSASVG